MNEQFYELPKEKQRRIINAGFEVFAANEYKRAVMDEIAEKAGISKGLLFYYFHNKRNLYLFLLDYGTALVKEQIVDQRLKEITDFFQLIAYASEKKVRILERNPFLSEFLVRNFYSSGEGVEGEANRNFRDMADAGYEEFFGHIDHFKFREGVKPRDIYNMLKWMADGYLHGIKSHGGRVDLEDMMEEFYKWSGLLKRVSYREEFTEEGR